MCNNIDLFSFNEISFFLLPEYAGIFSGFHVKQNLTVTVLGIKGGISIQPSIIWILLTSLYRGLAVFTLACQKQMA